MVNTINVYFSSFTTLSTLFFSNDPPPCIHCVWTVLISCSDRFMVPWGRGNWACILRNHPWGTDQVPLSTDYPESGHDPRKISRKWIWRMTWERVFADKSERVIWRRNSNKNTIECIIVLVHLNFSCLSHHVSVIFCFSQFLFSNYLFIL